MARNTIKFNSRGFRQILNSPGTHRAVNDAAYRIASKSGALVGNRRTGDFGGGRAMAYVMTRTGSPEEMDAARERLESAAYGA